MQRFIHVSQVTTLICFTQEALLSGHNDFSFMLTEQQRLIIADIINNEILRFENGIKEDGPGTIATHQIDSKNEQAHEREEDRLMSASEISVGQNAAAQNTDNKQGQGSVYSNLEMVMKQLYLSQKEWAKLGYGG